LPHNFSIEGLDVNVDVGAGDTETATFTAPSSPGEHKIFCDVVGHEGAGMVGAFIVEE
jgi:plastocyanin